MHKVVKAASNADIYAGMVTLLQTSNPAQKVALVRRLYTDWQNHPHPGETNQPPDHPAHPIHPALVAPAQVPRRRLGTQAGRIALLHAVAHIEFNAINLAADIICRFAHSPLIAARQRAQFITDWLTVCHDEARHFSWLEARLNALGSYYGAFSAHNGLWESAYATRHNLAARLAIVPMVLEARGLDVTPGMIEKLQKYGDTDSAAILQTIYDEEIAHVRYGTFWFNQIARTQNIQPEIYFQHLVQNYFSGVLKPPFNIAARQKAGLYSDFYAPLTSTSRK